MNISWACINCKYESRDPDINFPIICPSCGLIYSSANTIFNLDYKNNATIEELKSAQDLQKQYIETKKDQGKSAIEQGRKAWIKLHSCTVSIKELQGWFLEWENMIPKHGCSCKNDYMKLKNTLPPDFSSEYNFFVWGVKFHNLVNQKLGKEEYTIDQAIKEWRNA
jgi:hypothetical protein